MPNSTSRGPTRTGAVDRPGPREAAGAALVGAAIGLALVAAVAVITSWWWPGVAASLVVVPASAAAAVDVRFGRLPDLLVASSAAVGVFVAVVPRGATGLAFAVAGAACLAIPLLAVHLVSPVAMGFGDVKLGAALGAGVGSVSDDLASLAFAAMTALAMSSAVATVVALTRRRRDIAFGPGLVIGMIGALLVVDRLGVCTSSCR